MPHVDLTLPLAVLASPIVILLALRIVARIADARVAARTRALVCELERIHAPREVEREMQGDARASKERALTPPDGGGQG